MFLSCFSLALTEDGNVYSCGWGADGQTGLGHYNNCTKFTKVRGEIENEKIVKISSRSDFVLALNGKPIFHANIKIYECIFLFFFFFFR